MNRRLTILSVGRARATWPREIARWATAGLLPVDHHPCLGPDELEGRLTAVGRADVVMVDGGLADVGRDLIRRATARGSAVLVIDEEPRSWLELGATAVASPPVDPETLRRLLEQLSPVGQVDAPTAAPTAPQASGRAIAVTGHGGAGTSTVAHGLALRWGGDGGTDVVLADLSLWADQHVHHDALEAGPGLLDLVAGHERSTMSTEDVRHCTRLVAPSHRLLTGIRHPRDWTALNPAGVGAALDGLRAAFDVVVADVDDELDGRAETGSSDLEERNGLTRAAIRGAAAVIVVARADLLGVHRLCRQLEALVAAGVGPERMAVVANGARRRAPRPTAMARDVTELLGSTFAEARLVTVPHLAGLEARRRDARPPGRRLVRCLRPLDHLRRVETASPMDPPGPEPVGAER